MSLEGGRLEIRPEPTPAEHGAILAAVQVALETEQDEPPAWWHAGVAEATARGERLGDRAAS